MKSLLRIIIVITLLCIVFYYSSSTPKPLEGSDNTITELENVEEIDYNTESLQKPNGGISTYIGKTVDDVYQQFGEPNRIDETPYGYDWLVYNQYELYILFAVTDDYISQVYTNSTAYDIAPYSMYMNADDVYRMTIVDGEIAVKQGENVYLYMMNQYDSKFRILVQLDDIYAQIYIDEKEKKLIGIRFMDGQTLIMHKPYEVQFVGELLEEVPLHFNEQTNNTYAEQLFELTNAFRIKEKQAPLEKSELLQSIAKDYSVEMFEGKFVSHESPISGSLKDRVKANEISYKYIEENIATDFIDAIEAMHNLLNSNQHRKLLYDEKYTETGVGVYERYYTQIFLTPETIE